MKDDLIKNEKKPLLDPDYENEMDSLDEPDEEVKEIMEEHDLDEESAEKVKEIMDEYGLDEDDAVELEELI